MLAGRSGERTEKKNWMKTKGGGRKDIVVDLLKKVTIFLESWSLDIAFEHKYLALYRQLSINN